MHWDPELWPVVRVAIIALLAFIVVTVLAWPSNKALWRDLRERRRRLPAPPDPPSRMPVIPKPESVQGYEIVFNLLRFVSIQRDRLEKELAALDGEDTAARRRLERALAESLDNFSGLRDAAARFLAGLSDEQIAVISGFMSQSPEYCDGLVSTEECAAFLRDERRLLAGQSYLAAGHLDRLNGSGPGKLVEERRTSLDRGPVTEGP